MQAPSLESKRSALVSEIAWCVGRRSIRAKMARQSTEEVVATAISEWRPEYDNWQAEDVKRDLVKRVRRAGFGPVTTVILFAVLSAIIRAAVTELIYWWLDRKEERGKLLSELRG